MKILYLSDFSLKHTIGGAQRSNDGLIQRGLELGHEIDFINYDSNLAVLRDVHRYDYVVTSNFETLSRVGGLIDLVYSLTNHIRVERDMNLYLSEEDRYKLFSNCKKTFFLTDYHYQQFRNFYGDYFQNVQILPSPFDTKSFFDFGKERENITLYSGFCHSFKGTNVFIRYAKDNPDKKFVCSCWGSDFYIDQIKGLDNVEFLGKVEYSDMPNLYNRVDSFFYKPNMHEPLCRSVTEAILCGVPTMILNDKIGATHEVDRVGIDTFKDTCGSSANTFWRIMENI